MLIRATLGFAAALLLLGCSGTQPQSPPPARPCAQEAMTPPSNNATATAEDPTKTDPDKYQSVMENERVRVLRYHDEPGAKTHPHHHPASVLYALSAFKRRLSFPDGTTKEREFKPGDVMWVPAQTHVGENIGTTATDVVLVEMKGN
jgi:beta-alanine degradation protein BauB